MKHILKAVVSPQQEKKFADAESAVVLFLLLGIIAILLLTGCGKAIDRDVDHCRGELAAPTVQRNCYRNFEIADRGDVRSVPIKNLDVSSLIEDLGDSSAAVRWQAVYLLGKTRDIRAVEPLIGLIDDPEHDVRWRVVSVLGEFTDSRIVDPLIYALADDSRQIRIAAARSLGRQKDDLAIAALILVAGDADEGIREEVVLALGRNGSQEVVDPLIKALDDPQSYWIRVQAARALSAITGKKYVPGVDGLMVCSN